LDVLVEEFGDHLRGASLRLAGATSAGVERFLDGSGAGLRRLVLRADAELDLTAVDWGRSAPELTELRLTKTRVGSSIFEARSLKALELKECALASPGLEIEIDKTLPRLTELELVDTAISVRRIAFGEASPVESVIASHSLPAAPWFEEISFISCRELSRCKIKSTKTRWRARFSGDFPKLTVVELKGPRAVDVDGVGEGPWLVREARRGAAQPPGDPVRELMQLGYAVSKTAEGRHRIAPQMENGWSKAVSDLPGAERLERLGDVEALSLGSCRLTDAQLDGLLSFAGAARLRSLEVDGPRFRDASPLAACAELEELSLISAALQDPSPLAALPKLAALTLRLSEEPLDLSSLPRFPSLKRLDLTDSRVADHAPLLDCAGLERLEIGVVRYFDSPEVFETLRRRGVQVEPTRQAAGDFQHWTAQTAREAKKYRQALQSAKKADFHPGCAEEVILTYLDQGATPKAASAAREAIARFPEVESFPKLLAYILALPRSGKGKR
jgi:hypothetical protein